MEEDGARLPRFSTGIGTGFGSTLSILMMECSWPSADLKSFNLLDGSVRKRSYMHSALDYLYAKSNYFVPSLVLCQFCYQPKFLPNFFSHHYHLSNFYHR